MHNATRERTVSDSELVTFATLTYDSGVNYITRSESLTSFPNCIIYYFELPSVKNKLCTYELMTM